MERRRDGKKWKKMRRGMDNKKKIWEKLVERRERRKRIEEIGVKSSWKNWEKENKEIVVRIGELEG